MNAEERVRDLLGKALADARNLRGIVVCGITHDDQFMVGFANVSPQEMAAIGAYLMDHVTVSSEASGDSDDDGQAGH